MSKEYVTYQCGHRGIVDIYGAISERERKARYIGESSMCPECIVAARSAATEKAAAAAKAMALPSLEGSEKQVAWAESIRATMIANANAKMAAARKAVAKMVREARANYRTGVIAVRPTTVFLAQFLTHPSCPMVAAAARIEKIRTEKSAKWFIENR